MTPVAANDRYCFVASAPPSVSNDIAFAKVIKLLKLLKLHKTVDRCVTKSVLLMECGSGCRCNSQVCNKLTGSMKFAIKM